MDRPKVKNVFIRVYCEFSEKRNTVTVTHLQENTMKLQKKSLLWHFHMHEKLYLPTTKIGLHDMGNGI